MKPENQGELIIRLNFEIVQTWKLASLISCCFRLKVACGDRSDAERAGKC